MAKKGQKFKRYDKDLKLQVVIKRENGESLRNLREKYEIPSDAMIVRWLKEYKEHSMLAFEHKIRYTKEQIPTKGRPKVKFNSIEEELLENMNEYINYYNNERIQIRLKMSPVMYRTHHSSLN